VRDFANSLKTDEGEVRCLMPLTYKLGWAIRSRDHLLHARAAGDGGNHSRCGFAERTPLPDPVHNGCMVAKGIVEVRKEKRQALQWVFSREYAGDCPL
jgi:hypothetical protein